jgi:hypothetical protein
VGCLSVRVGRRGGRIRCAASPSPRAARVAGQAIAVPLLSHDASTRHTRTTLSFCRSIVLVRVRTYHHVPSSPPPSSSDHHHHHTARPVTMLNRLAPSSAASRAAARKSSPMRSRAATPQRVRFGRLGSRALRLERMRGEGDTLLVPHLVDPWIAPPPTRHVAASPVPRARPRRRLPRTSLVPGRGREHIPTSLRARASPAACDGRRADADEDARLPLSPSLSRPRPNPSPRLHHHLQRRAR